MTGDLMTKSIPNAILMSLEEQGLRRTLRALPGPGGKLRFGEREVLNLSSNDYLDFAGDPRVKRTKPWRRTWRNLPGRKARASSEAASWRTSAS